MENFKLKVVEAYGVGAYDLSDINYRGSIHKLNISCPDHGVFSITPDNFLYNAGCPGCRGRHPRGYPNRRAHMRRHKKRPGPKPVLHSFYIHEVSGGFLKIGITSGDVERRRVQIEGKSEFTHKVVYVKDFYNRRLLASIERALKHAFKMDVAPSGSMRDGSTETVASDCLPDIIRIVEAFPSYQVGTDAPRVPSRPPGG